MHGTISKHQLQKAAPRRKADIFALAVLGITAALVFLNYTAAGQHLLIQWGFIYPPDCG
jgi:hypothetical protein